MEHRVVLMVLDGWGIGAGDRGDAIAQAATPFIDGLYRRAPHATLRTDGEHVGLPSGQMGNSEVGHLNIGAGRVVYQDLVRIDRAIEDGGLERDPVLREAFIAAQRPGTRLHLIGLLSDGGVHAKRTHAEALCRFAARAGVNDIVVHAFADGRDTDPRTGRVYMERFLEGVRGTPARIGSVMGRYYAMDRDQRWERVARAYHALVNGTGDRIATPLEVFENNYAKGITDEFIEPALVVGEDGEVLTIRPGDVVLCFNFRTDRCREITLALTQRPFPEHGMAPLPLHYVTMTEYDPTFRDVRVLFRKNDLRDTLGEVVANNGEAQVRAAETEKYPHVTFFFSGGREEPFPGEERILVPSPKVATYDLQPEMSAPELTERVAQVLLERRVRLVVVNFANPDMVGHTGVFEAIVKAVETTDDCARRLVETGSPLGWSFVVIADHGNADKAINADGTPNTAHSTNPVPVFVLDDRAWVLRNGVLADVAPTVLHLLGMEKPVAMTGSSLLVAV